MTGERGQHPDDDQFAPAFDFGSLPRPAIGDRKQEALRDRKKQLALLFVLFFVAAVAFWAWASRPPDRTDQDLPRVTIEVRGMT